MRAVRGFFLSLALALLAACAESKETHKVRGEAFGTTIEISIYGVPEQLAHEVGARVLAEFGRLHRKFHAWKPSELTALNDAIARGEPYPSDAEMVTLLKAAAMLAESSDHLFNPAVGRLVRLWGFQTSEIKPQQPDQDEIRRLVAPRPRMTDLVFAGTTISSRNPIVMLDLGGYAKGYALDRGAQILRAAGVQAALINIGGNILAIGQPGERPWTVGIQNPRGEGVMAAVALHDNEAIGTSGDYQRYYMQGGKRRAHIIDPRTGETTDAIAAVTVIISGGRDPGTRSDGYSKPLFVAGPSHWEAMSRRLGLKEVMVVDKHGNVSMTPAMRERLALPRPAAS